MSWNGGFPRALTPGNIILTHVGAFDGSDCDDRFATPCTDNVMGHTYLDEYRLDGTLVQSINLNNLPVPMSQAYFTGGTGPSEGLISTSLDGRFLIFGGYNAPLGWGVKNTTVNGVGAAVPASWPAGAPSAPRVFARLGADGALGVIATATDTFQYDTLRSACSVDGNSVYAVGHGVIPKDQSGAVIPGRNGSVHFFTAGATSTTAVILDGTFAVSTDAAGNARGCLISSPDRLAHPVHQHAR